MNTPSDTEKSSPTGSAGLPPTLDMLLDLELRLSVSFGRTQLPLRDILKLSAGSLIELDCSADEPVEVIVNDRAIARGEVVVVDGNYGVRISEIASRRERVPVLPHDAHDPKLQSPEVTE